MKRLIARSLFGCGLLVLACSGSPHRVFSDGDAGRSGAASAEDGRVGGSSVGGDGGGPASNAGADAGEVPASEAGSEAGGNGNAADADSEGQGGACEDCAPAVCQDGETRCSGGETELSVEVCAPDRTGFEPSAWCDEQQLQCNPTADACFVLGMDETEVTRERYASFVASAYSTEDQEPGCSFNDSVEPDPDCVRAGLAAAQLCDDTQDDCSQQPQTCVDWCDAYAFCQAQGQRLCGRIGGGMNPFDRYADPGSSQWMNGCSAGGQFEYGSGTSAPSGPNQCSYNGSQLGTTYAVSERASCHSPSPGYDHLFDLSGNVAEWEDSCEKDVVSDRAGQADACRTRGGSYASNLDELSCGRVSTIPLARSDTSPTVGFRCCGTEQ